MDIQLRYLLEARTHFFRHRRSENTQRAYLLNEAHVLDLIDRMYTIRTLPATITLPIPWNATWADPVTVAPTNEQRDAAFQDVENPEGSCPICQEELRARACVRLRNCSHTFHRECAVQWYTMSVRCPLCRNDIRTTNPPNTNE